MKARLVRCEWERIGYAAGWLREARLVDHSYYPYHPVLVRCIKCGKFATVPDASGAHGPRDPKEQHDEGWSWKGLGEMSPEERKLAEMALRSSSVGLLGPEVSERYCPSCAMDFMSGDRRMKTETEKAASSVSGIKVFSGDGELRELASLDTRSSENMVKANRIILGMLQLKVGDVLKATSDNGLQGSRDRNYEVLEIHPDGYVDLLARESGRVMTRSPLFSGTRWNRPRWEKVVE